MQRPSANPQVNVETLKLLLQTAWADDTLDPKEREAVAALCERWAVPEEVSRTLLERLDLGKPLPPPNLASASTASSTSRRRTSSPPCRNCWRAEPPPF